MSPQHPKDEILGIDDGLGYEAVQAFAAHDTVVDDIVQGVEEAENESREKESLRVGLPVDLLSVLVEDAADQEEERQVECPDDAAQEAVLRIDDMGEDDEEGREDLSEIQPVDPGLCDGSGGCADVIRELRFH